MSSSQSILLLGLLLSVHLWNKIKKCMVMTFPIDKLITWLIAIFIHFSPAFFLFNFLNLKVLTQVRMNLWVNITTSYAYIVYYFFFQYMTTKKFTFVKSEHTLIGCALLLFNDVAVRPLWAVMCKLVRQALFFTNAFPPALRNVCVAFFSAIEFSEIYTIKKIQH